MADNARRAEDECLRASRGCGGGKRMMGMAQGQAGEGRVTCASYDYGQTEDRCKYFRTYLVLPPLSAEQPSVSSTT